MFYRNANETDSGLVEFAFGDSPEVAKTLLALVLSGRKTATCSALSSFDGQPIAKPGDKQVVLDERGNKACLIEITSVKIIKFCDVESDFAAKEGEGDLSLANWRKSHKAYFLRADCYEPEMLLVCEQFRLIEVV